MATKTAPATDEATDEAEGGEVVEPEIGDVLKANRAAADKFMAATGITAEVLVDKSTKVKADLGAQEMDAFPAKKKEEDEDEDDEDEGDDEDEPAVASDSAVKEETPRHFRCERYPNLVVPDFDIVFVDGWFTTDDPSVIAALGRIPEVVMQDKPED